MKNFKIEIKWGIIFAVASLVWMCIEKMVGLHDKHIDKQFLYTNIFAVFAILIYVLGLRDKKKHFFNGQMDWKQGFVSGIVITIVVAVLSPLTQVITNTLITPDFFSNAIAYAVEHKKMTQELAEAYFNLSSYIVQGIFGALSMGVVTSAIVAFFLKSK
ncbi:DUF4199 domain-containing protein [Flavobacterium pedocola]